MGGSSVPSETGTWPEEGHGKRRDVAGGGTWLEEGCGQRRDVARPEEGRGQRRNGRVVRVGQVPQNKLHTPPPSFTISTFSSSSTAFSFSSSLCFVLFHFLFFSKCRSHASCFSPFSSASFTPNSFFSSSPPSCFFLSSLLSSNPSDRMKPFSWKEGGRGKEAKGGKQGKEEREWMEDREGRKGRKKGKGWKEGKEGRQGLEGREGRKRREGSKGRKEAKGGKAAKEAKEEERKKGRGREARKGRTPDALPLPPLLHGSRNKTTITEAGNTQKCDSKKEERK